MNRERWQQVDRLLEQALEQEPDRRAAFLDDACQGDVTLRREVESLLSAHRKADDFIEAVPMEAAARRTSVAAEQSLTGRQLGHYQILSRLGEGGMGIVYKARDTHLDRVVAIKVLPPELVADPDRKRRFVQEAKAASALNHPNIITVHDIASDHGTDFIVMECVQGKTLGQLIPRRGLKLNEVLKYAIQIADALAKAQAAGIIHRDLKPGNIMVGEGGLVKVLDFGLAKLTERPLVGEEDSTRSIPPWTDEGTILGTASYMSPEQAAGKPVDARSDVFSFGSVLYEMVTGQRAFQGDSKMSILAAVLNQEPKPASEISRTIPHDLEKIITRCLRKAPERRWQTMADLKVALEELKEESNSPLLAGAAPARPARRTWVWAGAALVVVSLAVAVWLFRGTARKPAPTPEVVPLTSYAGFERSPSFSPDGNQVVFSWNGERQDNFDIYVKLIGFPTPVRLTTDPAEDVTPAFSPDGRSIGFVRISKEHATFIVIPAIGGSERITGEVPLQPGTYVARPLFAWLPDGKWVVTGGLALLSTESGETLTLTSPPKSATDYSPVISPDGRTVAFNRTSSYDWEDIYLLDLTTDLKPQAEPRRLTSLKAFILGSAWTGSGREIIFASAFFGTGSSLWKVRAGGSREPELLPYSAGEAYLPAISRSGDRLVYQREVSDANIWRLLLEGPATAIGPPARFIATTRQDTSPQYSPDGKRIAFESDQSGVYGIWVSDADGSNAVELISQAGASCGNSSWSPDGQRIAFNLDAGGNTDIYIIRASGGKPIRLTTDQANDEAGSWSRDGNWIYFTSRRTGRWEVWKVSAGGGENFQVTRNGGGKAFESLDSKFVYYTKGEHSGALWKIPVIGGEESQVLPSVFRAFSHVSEGIYFIPEAGADGKSSIQFLSFASAKVKTVTPISGSPFSGLSVSPDGRSLLFSQIDEAGSDLMLVENFR